MPFDVIYDLYKMKQFHLQFQWLLCVAKNCDWSRKIAPLSNLTRAALLVEWKLTAKAELNCEIYKSWRKCWKNQVSFCHWSSPVSRKARTLPWKLQDCDTVDRELWLAIPSSLLCPETERNSNWKIVSSGCSELTMKAYMAHGFIARPRTSSAL